MMMKKYASLLFALVLALSLSVSAAADSSGVYVYDDAALLTQEEYDKKRQEIFRIAQPYFQPAAVSFTDKKGQREYLLEKDFLTYRNEELSKRYATPMYFLQELLQESENDNPQDAHLAFQGEDGIATDELWDSAQIQQMAVCGWEILMEYSGLGACGWLVRGENGK